MRGAHLDEADLQGANLGRVNLRSPSRFKGSGGKTLVFS
ncbi:pentapeptide repeat-containing protein [Argonema galeatum]|nr:pentapeptide repeat-containing protein [Argonema galeatum A003/A1]